MSHRCASCCRLICAIITTLWLTAALASETIRYPRTSTKNDRHADYVLELLQAAMNKLPGKYHLVASELTYPQTRFINETASAKGKLDLIWTMTTEQREAQLIPIRIPIDKGALGWRIALLRKNDKDLFKNVKSLADLQHFSAGQVHDWPDTAILRHSGLPVSVASSYEPLFAMLAAARFDYFPRAIFEVWQEFDEHREQGIVIDQAIVLHYDSAEYFFVSPRHAQFAADLRTALESLIVSGDFDKLFQKYYRDILYKANIRQRSIIELPNPMIARNKLPLNRSELWVQP
ncbi:MULTISPECIES: transporter substrate-binding domain-containing protein [unclassified Undibacterium]|uniref:transporter substrate-binding domain-containing protein n=1 Tax=unclassified Undibacterium TaxID=2630295 RepID=UPI002AC9457F|nr:MULTISPECIES: transporter substrate-binding domain-containing protein [unclassified Undibacterium]MEB0138284.1 transporter substrate-binding domain-containing protein [Undibacterium sp. CCC2.1]MEB0170770.1 transporter substrate-binding domain-containing protein [Undibacterium sp. CCC1.1]MEB0174659.1 transporter substrate-binding domain-containing protein [Undibacterium sp. CCC3.4]MEB0213856.1 transporter substrate-binding domain-containing protein [Undibacterium sp. 5I2]WPX42582.1 transport